MIDFFSSLYQWPNVVGLFLLCRPTSGTT